MRTSISFASRTYLEAVASSLTELFSGKLITLRMDRLRQHYPWLSSGLDYFEARMTQAPEDANFALAWVVKHARTREEQEMALGALRAKCDILWAHAGCALFCVRVAGLAAAGRVSTGARIGFVKPEMSSRPQLARRMPPE